MGTDGLYTPLVELLNLAVRQGFLCKNVLQHFVVADTPAELLAGLEQVAQSGAYKIL